MKVLAQVLLDVPEESVKDLNENWGVGLVSFLHDELDIAVNYKIKSDALHTKHGYKLVGIRVRDFATGELFGQVGRADRHFGTDRVMVYDSLGICMRSLSGRSYREIRDIVIVLSDSETKFYHRIPSDDPIQPVEEKEVSREEW